MKPYYYPLDPTCKSVIGGIEENRSVLFRIRSDAEQCALMIRGDQCAEAKSYPMSKNGLWFERKVKLQERGLYWYSFRFPCGICGADAHLECTFDHPKEYLLLVYRSGFKTPEWIKGQIIYQIFPDRFHKVGNIPIGEGKILRCDWGGTPNHLPDENGEILNNDFFGGNLVGICEKLPYLSELGVSAIYLNPIFEAYSNHRYDTGDYCKIDPLLGNTESFEVLLKKAESFGIRIILDGVFNHTGADSIYFNRYGTYDSLGAYQSKLSPYYNWFEFQQFPNQYSSWWGIQTLPSIRKDSRSFQAFIAGEDGVLSRYKNIGGWRLDVADELSSDFIRQIRTRIKQENSDNLLIGEVWEDAAEKIAYNERKPYFCGDELDSVMNYPLKDAILDFLITGNAEKFVDVLRNLIDHYPKECLDVLMNILDTHDTERVLTVLGAPLQKEEDTIKRKYAIEKLKVASLLQFTVPGVPCVYYGDEVGMVGKKDPFNRGCFPWGNEDCEIHEWYRKISRIRRKVPLFKKGEYRERYVDKTCVVFERREEVRAITIAVNRGDKAYVMRYEGLLYDLLTGKSYLNGCTLKPYTCLVLYDEDITE